GGFGIEVNNVTEVVIGDSSANGRNVISANSAGGISFHGKNASLNAVDNNFIGTQADGVSPLGNGGWGVIFSDNADYNAIGPYYSSSNELGNTIAFNAGAGVLVTQAVGNRIRSNSIFNNSNNPFFNNRGGIDLDFGLGNNGQVAPVLTSVASQVLGTHVSGTF